jgi:signal transduction histidine kinase
MKNSKIPTSILVAVAFLLEIFIGFIDWKVRNEMPFTIFFILPLLLIATQENISKSIIVVNSLFTAFIWVFVYYEKETVVFVVFNGFLRFVVFLVISYFVQLLTKQKKLLEQQNQELKVLNDEKNQILGIAAHDIRNGVLAIYSFSELLTENETLKNNLKEEYEFVDIIHNASQNLLTLLSNLLNISRIEAGTVTLQPISIEYIAFVEERLKLLKYIAKNKEIEIIPDFKVPKVMLEFDPIYLREVIDNLLSNAVKYSFPQSQITFTVSQKDHFILTEITDCGVGIKEHEMTTMFKVFSKTSSQPTQGEKSTGLGLAIAKKNIELHNGTIGVRSVLGKGSTFYFTLPMPTK